MYSITIDSDRKMICATLTGFFSVDEVDAFVRDEQAAVRSLGCRSGGYVLLVHAPGKMIQTQDVTSAFQRAIAGAPIKARRIAVVATGALYSMQTRRILTSDQSALFAETSDAEEWLFEDDEVAQRSAA